VSYQTASASTFDDTNPSQANGNQAAGIAEAARAVRRSTEARFIAHDGAELFYRAWSPSTPTSRALILFHRGHEHSARWQETVDRLNLPDVAIFAWDQRGHGNSPGDRGSAPSLATVIADAESFSRHLMQAHGVRMEDTIVLAHSVGAVVATAWVHDYAPPIRGLVLGTPAFRVKLYVPLAIPALRLKQRFIGPGYVQSYVKSKMLTSDTEQAKIYSEDPQIFRQIAVNILLDLQDTSTRLLADAGAITTPTLILAAGNDWVVNQKAQWKFFERLSSPIKQMELYPRAKHAIFHDVERKAVVARTRKFIDECYMRETTSDARPFLEADQGGYTRTEFDRLRAPGPLHWKFMEISMATICQLSDGFRVGKRTGYDSGLSLDYVYTNRAGGITPIGKLIDHAYLNAVGWRGIRVRGQNIRTILRQAIDRVSAAGLPVRVLDIASGPGRYVLETIKAMPHAGAIATLRDYRQENLDAARALADELQLNGTVQTIKGDAFDRASLAATSPAPTIAIASGIYELFSDNTPVLRSLAGLADVVPPGGYLIYTTQIWHPQVEFIARTLTNHEGKPWIMRRRTQREMDELVRSVGFEKTEQLIDPWGIFTVSIARRVMGQA